MLPPSLLLPPGMLLCAALLCSGLLPGPMLPLTVEPRGRNSPCPINQARRASIRAADSMVLDQSEERKRQGPLQD